MTLAVTRTMRRLCCMNRLLIALVTLSGGLPSFILAGRNAMRSVESFVAIRTRQNIRSMEFRRRCLVALAGFIRALPTARRPCVKIGLVVGRLVAIVALHRLATSRASLRIH